MNERCHKESNSPDLNWRAFSFLKPILIVKRGQAHNVFFEKLIGSIISVKDSKSLNGNNK